MYKVVSPEWNITIEDGFKTAEEAYAWGYKNCGAATCWNEIWAVEYYNPNPFTMTM